MSALTLDYRPLFPDDLWRRRSLLELYPFDGGGGFIHRALLGTIDDREIRRKFLAGDLSHLLQFPHMDFARYEHWRHIELGCWLNRCYLVACLAHAAWLEEDRSLARLLKETMLHFLRTCPPPGGGDPEALKKDWELTQWRMVHDYNEKTYEEYSKDETVLNYRWYDFQPASRLLHFLHAFYFLKDLADFTPEELRELTEGLFLHGQVLFRQESFLPDTQGNHQAVRQIGLLHAAAAFSQVPETRAWRDLAFRRIAWHALNDFFPNGVLFENSPSYHAFETWHGRDALALARHFGQALEPEAEERFRQAAQVLAAYRRPDGKTLVINDAYPLLPDGLLESMEIDPRRQPRTTLLQPGGLAVWRGKRLYAALDVSSFTGKFSHYHGGKNALTLFLDNTPILDDPGCCNYDDPRFRACKQADVHGSLLVEGTPDAHSFSVYGWDSHPEFQLTPWLENRFQATLTSSTPEWEGVTWIRAITGGEDSLLLEDQVRGLAGRRCEFRFTAAPGVVIHPAEKGFLLEAGALRVAVEYQGTIPPEVQLRDGENFQTDPALPVQQLCLAFPAAQTLSFQLRFCLA
ncbi:MAG: heparinase II/III family protein [Oligosphaeraceae bacterium]